MSNRKQFLILVCVFSLVAIIVGWVQLGKVEEVDNVIDFTIKAYHSDGSVGDLNAKGDKAIGGIVTKYFGAGEEVELPYVYKVSGSKAVFGYDYRVLALGADAFKEGNEITRLAISTYMQIIYDNAFNNLDKLEILIVRASTPPKISASEIQKLSKLKVIYIYSNAMDDYATDSVWSQFSDKFEKI